MKMADALFSSSWRILEQYGCSGILSPQLRRIGTLMPAWSEDLREHPDIATLDEGRLEYALCLNSGTASSQTNF
jgi:hypothetical protein